MLPIAEEGVTEMQIKIIGARVDGAEAVLATPRFAVEVTKSNADDGSAEQSTSFTALENAVAKASAIYDKRLTKIEVDENCVFKALYADRTEYESTAIRDSIVAVSTDADIERLIRNAIDNQTVDSLAQEFYDRDLFAKAKYTTDLGVADWGPTFLEWGFDTYDTPYRAGLTDISSGFAISYGDVVNRTTVAWVLGDRTKGYFVKTITNGVDNGWTRAYDNEEIIGKSIKTQLGLETNATPDDAFNKMFSMMSSLVTAESGFDGSGFISVTTDKKTIGISDWQDDVKDLSFKIWVDLTKVPDNARICYIGDIRVDYGKTKDKGTYYTNVYAIINGTKINEAVFSNFDYSGNSLKDLLRSVLPKMSVNVASLHGRPLINTDWLEFEVELIPNNNSNNGTVDLEGTAVAKTVRYIGG
jgi:hypothetical protein